MFLLNPTLKKPERVHSIEFSEALNTNQISVLISEAHYQAGINIIKLPESC